MRRLGVVEYGVMKIQSLTDRNSYIPFGEEKSHYMQHDVLCKKRIIQDNAKHQIRKSHYRTLRRLRVIT